MQQAVSPNAFNLIGVGGVGVTIVERLSRTPLPGVRYLGIDTDERRAADNGIDRLLLEGLPGGSGRAAKAAYAAAQRSGNEIAAALADNQFALIVASFGGGTGAGASPAVAKFARNGGGLAVILAIEPPDFEGSRRSAASNEAIHFALDLADAVIRVPNRDVAEICGPDVPMKEALRRIDEQVAHGAHAIMAVAAGCAGMGLDLGVVRRTLASSGLAVMGYGQAPAAGSLREALRQALSSSFLYPEELRRTAHVLVYVQGGESLPVAELRSGSQAVAEFTGDAELLVGLGPPPSEDEPVSITLLGCGLQEAIQPQASEKAAPLESIGPANLFDGENLEIPAFIRRQRRFGV